MGETWGKKALTKLGCDFVEGTLSREARGAHFHFCWLLCQHRGSSCLVSLSYRPTMARVPGVSRSDARDEEPTCRQIRGLRPSRRRRCAGLSFRESSPNPRPPTPRPEGVPPERKRWNFEDFRSAGSDRSDLFSQIDLVQRRTSGPPVQRPYPHAFRGD